MAYTFGAAATDTIQRTTVIDPYTQNRQSLVYAWWYPTTLTAGRAYYGMSGGTSGLRVDATTDELIFTLDRATTDYTFVSSDADIVVDTWYFIAVHISQGAISATPNTRIWLGTADSPPRLLTGSTTNGSGNRTAGPRVVLGNTTTTSSVSFQGDIEHAGYICANPSSDAESAAILFGHSDTSAAPNDEFILSRLVSPLWRGEFPAAVRACTGAAEYAHHPLINSGRGYRVAITATSVTSAAASSMTISGATPSNRRGPRDYVGSPLHGDYRGSI